MSDIEAIEYRIASLHGKFTLLAVMNILVCAFTLIIIGGIAGGPIGTLAIALGITNYVGGLALTMDYYATSKGRFTTLLSKLGASYPDPPLEQWHESLEDRNAFPVDGDDSA